MEVQSHFCHFFAFVFVASSGFVTGCKAPNKQAGSKGRKVQPAGLLVKKAAAKRKTVKSEIPRGYVLFSVRKADLKTKVLPHFQRAGVPVVWRGGPKRVSLNIMNPMPWNVALDLLCRFHKLSYRKEGGRVLLFNEGDALSGRSFDKLPDGTENTIKDIRTGQSSRSAYGRASAGSTRSSRPGSASSSTGKAANSSAGDRINRALDRRTVRRNKGSN
jgi:hypothetical protein